MLQLTEDAASPCPQHQVSPAWRGRFQAPQMNAVMCPTNFDTKSCSAELKYFSKTFWDGNRKGPLWAFSQWNLCGARLGSGYPIRLTGRRNNNSSLIPPGAARRELPSQSTACSELFPAGQRTAGASALDFDCRGMYSK